MRQRKSKQILTYFFLLFLLGSITNLTFQNNQLLNLKKIIVSGLDEKENEYIKNKINKLIFVYFFFDASFKIHSINLIKLIPLNAAISGTRESFVIPG